MVGVMAFAYLASLAARHPSPGVAQIVALASPARENDTATIAPSPTPQPTRTPLPLNPTFTPTLPDPLPTHELVRAHLSYYWPPLGQINCDYECEHIANGDDWKLWVGKGLACPSEYPLGTIFLIIGIEWQCVDRGDAIVKNSDGSIWLDLLLSKMPDGLAWGSIRIVEVRRGG